ncbi:MAG TPA: methyltransferase domain-containing protein [Ktedonosporobacter sp.]|nr:methyltransferase domain-containing protein [Ktedonosporobacter sp.]
MPDPYKDNPSTYFVQDRSSKDEMTRLHIQDQMFTASMGGVLPEQANPAIFQSVLDVGCGTGDWLIEVAKTYPHMSRLVGVDISERMVKYANKQAAEQQVSDRVQFQVMDALRRFEFSDHSFDLVNQRFGVSWLRTWDWPNLLSEYRRITQPGGLIRVTEGDMIAESSSPALLRLFALGLQALYQSGHYFTPKSDGIISQLVPLFNQHGGHSVQKHAYVLEYRAGTPELQSFAEDMHQLFRIGLPFLRKWAHVPDEYESIYQQMLTEMQQPDFTATLNLLTVWGIKANS